MKKISIAIADDHVLIRQMWQTLFKDNAAFEVIGESGTITETVELVKAIRPDILFLDINLAKESGMDAVPLVRKFSPGTKIIAVSMYNEVSIAKRMLSLGAKAYITKSSSGEEVFKALDVVNNGGVYLCEEIELQYTAHKGEKDKAGSAGLSVREVEIIKKIKEGYSSKEIAAMLFIAIRTVEAHRRNILSKLKLKNTAALINFINHTDLDFI